MKIAPPTPSAEILAIGEPMVEFNQTRQDAGRLYLQGFGGDTSNFAVAAARQGARVGYLSALGDDPCGRMLRRMWDEEGVDHRNVLTNPAAYTAVYFVTHDVAGHHFDFFRKGSAASAMKTEDLPREFIRAAKVLHLSGISLAISESARQACFEAIAIARSAGVKVSFDTNMRLKLWPVGVARPVMLAAIAQSDICLPSLEDMISLGFPDEPESIVRDCLALGAQCVVLKLGPKGAMLGGPEGLLRLAPHPCQPLDATGAGDTFGGAFVARIVAGDTPLEAARYAGVAAALSTEGYGAVAPIPDAARVRAALGMHQV